MSNPTAAGAAAGLALPPPVLDRLREGLPAVAELAVGAIIVEVPDYARALTGSMGQNIRNAVELALGGFLSLAARPRGADLGTPMAPALEGAYALGRGEARSGRTMEALLAAYRVGARVSWRELSTAAVAAGLPAATLAQFAELVFAYIDELSAASVAGHADELTTSGQVRERYLHRLGRSLLAGDPVERLLAAADRADWPPPRTLTAVLLPGAHVRAVLPALDPRTLRPEEDLPDLADDERDQLAVLLVPDVGRRRATLLRSLRGHHAVAGPERPWTRARASYVRALGCRRLLATAGPGSAEAPGDALDTGDAVDTVDAVDSEDHLVPLVLTADREALADLRAQVLAPLEDLRPHSAARLRETLRAWLLHHGRREEVAAVLHVHPQTVRYRMGRLRELYGERLDDPATVLALTVALATDGPSGGAAPAPTAPGRSRASG